MQKRHFEVIAETIANIEDNATRANICALFVRRLKLENTKFKTGIFLSWSNVTEEEFDQCTISN